MMKQSESSVRFQRVVKCGEASGISCIGGETYIV